MLHRVLLAVVTLLWGCNGGKWGTDRHHTIAPQGRGPASENSPVMAGPAVGGAFRHRRALQPGCEPGAPATTRSPVTALDIGTSVNFCSNSALGAAIYLPPCQQDRPFADGGRHPSLGNLGTVASRAELTPVNVQRMYAESQRRSLQSARSISSSVTFHLQSDSWSRQHKGSVRQRSGNGQQVMPEVVI
jgi:hypothetical protein